MFAAEISAEICWIIAWGIPKNHFHQSRRKICRSNFNRHGTFRRCSVSPTRIRNFQACSCNARSIGGPRKIREKRRLVGESFSATPPAAGRYASGDFSKTPCNQRFRAIPGGNFKQRVAKDCGALFVHAAPQVKYGGAKR